MAWVDMGANVAQPRDTVTGAAQLGIPALLLRQDADGISESSGDLAIPQLDSSGRLKTAAMPNLYPLLTGTITNATTPIVVDVSRCSSIYISVLSTTVFAGVNVTFEGSVDGTKWDAIMVARSNANTLDLTSGVLSAAPAYGWRVGTVGFQQIRVRPTAWTSGTQSWAFQRSSFPIEVAPNVPTHAVTQSGTWTTTPTNTGAPYGAVTAATTNATSVKTSTGALYELTIFNPTVTAAYVKLYSKASAPTVGTDVPLVTIPVAAGAFVVMEFGAVGKRFGLGIAVAVTGAAVATDTTATVAGIQLSGTYI